MALPEQDRIDISDLISQHRKVTARRAALGQAAVSEPAVSEPAAGPREVLERLRQASISQSADDLSQVYAAEAIHEFPFTRPGLPSRLSGRDAIVSWITAGWKGNPLKYERYRTLAIHDTSDPETIIAEQEVLGTSTVTGEFALPNLVVLTVRHGQIVRLRDYVNIPVAAAALGSAV